MRAMVRRTAIAVVSSRRIPGGWPIQAFLWLEWGGSNIGYGMAIYRTLFLGRVGPVATVIASKQVPKQKADQERRD